MPNDSRHWADVFACYQRLKGGFKATEMKWADPWISTHFISFLSLWTRFKEQTNCTHYSVYVCVCV